MSFLYLSVFLALYKVSLDNLSSILKLTLEENLKFWRIKKIIDESKYMVPSGSARHSGQNSPTTRFCLIENLK